MCASRQTPCQTADEASRVVPLYSPERAGLLSLFYSLFLVLLLHLALQLLVALVDSVSALTYKFLWQLFLQSTCYKDVWGKFVPC